MTHGCLKDLDWTALPAEVAPLKLNLVWHQRYDNDPAHRWFREQIIATVNSITNTN